MKLTILLPLLLFSAHAAEPSLQRYAFKELHMATTWRVVVYASSDDAANTASRAAFDEIARLDAMLSDFNDDSELCRLNAQSGGPPVKVSAELYEVLAASLKVASRTAGAFDVTVGPVVDLWKRAQRRKEPPDPEKLAAAQTLVGLSSLLLDERARTVELKKKGMRLDVGGIAKGFAADRALRILKARGCPSALVAGGGDIAVGAPPPGEPGWKIEIQPLRKDVAHTGHTLLLFDAGVSTSGDVEQHLDIGGKRYSHIVDPATGKAIEGHSSITVVAPDCTQSDSLATAVSVAGVKKGLSALDQTPGAAGFFAIERDGRVSVEESGGWKAVPKK